MDYERRFKFSISFDPEFGWSIDNSYVYFDYLAPVMAEVTLTNICLLEDLRYELDMRWDPYMYGPYPPMDPYMDPYMSLDSWGYSHYDMNVVDAFNQFGASILLTSGT